MKINLQMGLFKISWETLKKLEYLKNSLKKCGKSISDKVRANNKCKMILLIINTWLNKKSKNPIEEVKGKKRMREKASTKTRKRIQKIRKTKKIKKKKKIKRRKRKRKIRKIKIKKRRRRIKTKAHTFLKNQLINLSQKRQIQIQNKWLNSNSSTNDYLV